MSLIFFAIALQESGNYINVWNKKIIDHFSENKNENEKSSIIDRTDVFAQVYENKDKGIPCFGGWIGWEELRNAEKKYFFPLIEKSDFIVAAEAFSHPRRGKYTANVIVEIEYALEIGKKVFGINIENWTFKEITKDDLIKIKKEKEDEIIFLKFLERSL